MPRPARPWFRFYVEALGDRKIRRFTPAQRWLWVAILGCARSSPVPGTLLVSGESAVDDHDLADIAGMPARDVARAMPLFESAGMIQRTATGAWVVVKWNERQYESDDITERTRKHRSKERDRNVPTTFPGTPPETETDKESPTDSLPEPMSPARRVAITHWEQSEPRPVLTGGFIALLKLCERFLDAGHTETELLSALARTRAYTNDAVTFSLRETTTNGGTQAGGVLERFVARST